MQKVYGNLNARPTSSWCNNRKVVDLPPTRSPSPSSSLSLSLSLAHPRRVCGLWMYGSARERGVEGSARVPRKNHGFARGIAYAYKTE